MCCFSRFPLGHPTEEPIGLQRRKARLRQLSCPARQRAFATIACRLRARVRLVSGQKEPGPALTHDRQTARLVGGGVAGISARSEEHTSELQSLMRISYAVFCLKKKTNTYTKPTHTLK